MTSLSRYSLNEVFTEIIGASVQLELTVKDTLFTHVIELDGFGLTISDGSKCQSVTGKLHEFQDSAAFELSFSQVSHWIVLNMHLSDQDILGIINLDCLEYVLIARTCISYVCLVYDINARNGYDSTPIHFASKSCWQDAALTLVNIRADLNVADKDQKSPLDLAETSGVLTLEADKWTPLMLAAE